MQLVFDQPGINVQEAAQSLRMQPRNVSTLVTGLVADGLIERIPDPENGRRVQLHPTSKPHEGSRQIDASLRDDVAEALAAMPSEHEAQIAAALPALRDLAQRLSRSTPPERPPADQGAHRTCAL
jgi:DNA-binding MarR family transcriptional regulator